MLLVCTCNPAGEGATYNGLYYKQDELQAMVASGALKGIPVKTEHTGSEVGRVVSSFIDGSGALQCVMEVDENTVEGSIAGGFVRDGITADLSLGYTVDVQHSDDRLRAGHKNLLEISLVRKGARRGCHISAYEGPVGGVVYAVPRRDAWACFDMRGGSPPLAATCGTAAGAEAGRF